MNTGFYIGHEDMKLYIIPQKMYRQHNIWPGFRVES